MQENEKTKNDSFSDSNMININENFFYNNENPNQSLKSFDYFFSLLELKRENRTEEDKKLINSYLLQNGVVENFRREKVPELDFDHILKTFILHLKSDVSPANKILFRFDDLADKFYIIFKGKVSILIPKVKRIQMVGGSFYNYLISLYLTEQYYILKATIAGNYEEICFSHYDEFLKYEKINFKNLFFKLTNGFVDKFNIENIMNFIKYYKRTTDCIGIENEEDLIQIYKLDQLLFLLKEKAKKASEYKLSLAYVSKFTEENNSIFNEFLTCINKDNFQNYNFKNLINLQRIFAELNLNKEIIDNIHLIKQYENPQSIKDEETLINVIDKYHFVFKYGSLKNYLNELFKLNHQELYISQKYSYMQDFDTELSTSLKQYKIYYYEKVKELNSGDYFGNDGLDSHNKKRICTALTEDECYFGTIDNKIYNHYIYQEKRQILIKNIEFLTSNSLLKPINTSIFEKSYYDDFKISEFTRDSLIFKQAEISEKIIYGINIDELQLQYSALKNKGSKPNNKRIKPIFQNLEKSHSQSFRDKDDKTHKINIKTKKPKEESTKVSKQIIPHNQPDITNVSNHWDNSKEKLQNKTEKIITEIHLDSITNHEDQNNEVLIKEDNNIIEASPKSKKREGKYQTLKKISNGIFKRNRIFSISSRDNKNDLTIIEMDNESLKDTTENKVNETQTPKNKKFGINIQRENHEKRIMHKKEYVPTSKVKDKGNNHQNTFKSTIKIRASNKIKKEEDFNLNFEYEKAAFSIPDASPINKENLNLPQNTNNISLFLLKQGTIDVYFHGNLIQLQELIKILIDKLFLFQIIHKESYEKILRNYLQIIDLKQKSNVFTGQFLAKKFYLLYTVNSNQFIGIELLFFNLPYVYLAKVKSNYAKGFYIDGNKLKVMLTNYSTCFENYNKIAITKINSLICRLNSIKNLFLNIITSKEQDFIKYKAINEDINQEIDKYNGNFYKNQGYIRSRKENEKIKNYKVNLEEINKSLDNRDILNDEKGFNNNFYNPANVKNVTFFDLKDFQKNKVYKISEHLNDINVTKIHPLSSKKSFGIFDYKATRGINNGIYNNKLNNYYAGLDSSIDDEKDRINKNSISSLTKNENEIRNDRTDILNNSNNSIIISYFKLSNNYNNRKQHPSSKIEKKANSIIYIQENYEEYQTSKIPNKKEVKIKSKNHKFQEKDDIKSSKLSYDMNLNKLNSNIIINKKANHPHYTNNLFFTNIESTFMKRDYEEKIIIPKIENLSSEAKNIISGNHSQDGTKQLLPFLKLKNNKSENLSSVELNLETDKNCLNINSIQYLSNQTNVNNLKGHSINKSLFKKNSFESQYDVNLEYFKPLSKYLQALFFIINFYNK